LLLAALWWPTRQSCSSIRDNLLPAQIKSAACMVLMTLGTLIGVVIVSDILDTCVHKESVVACDSAGLL